MDLSLAIVVMIGAAIVLIKTMLCGYAVHVWLLKHAPGLAALIPRDGGALAGLLAGLVIVAMWRTM